MHKMAILTSGIWLFVLYNLLKLRYIVQHFYFGGLIIFFK